MTKWPAGAATGIGSLPGTDIAEALRVVLGELPDLPHLPELPARGPGADMIGRAAGLLVDLPVELHVGRWRIAGARGVDARRTADLWQRDLDELTGQAADYRGAFKIQCAGPWTVAASLDLAVGGRLLRDAGAVRDLTSSLAEGLAGHVKDVQARLPYATLVLQLDEPSLPAVLAGQIPTESGFSALRSVEPAAAVGSLREVIGKAGVPVVVHCCAPEVPTALLHQAGAAAIGFDLALLKDDGWDAVGEAIDAGVRLFAGALSTDAAPAPAVIADRVRDLWRRLGFPLRELPDKVVVTPACGLAGSSPSQARQALEACRDAAHRLRDEAGA